MSRHRSSRRRTRTSGASAETVRLVHGLRSSSAASPHVPGPRRGARGDRERREITEQLKN